MNEIEEKEIKKYSTIWGFDSYRERSPGLRFVEQAMEMLQPAPNSSIIDLGCGTGRVANYFKMKGLNTTALDLVDNACNEFDGPFIKAPLWRLDDIGSYDFGFCADVMEHLPTELVDDALYQISKHCNRVYFQIANFHDHEGDKIGESLHLTVKPFSWWALLIKSYFKVTNSKLAPKHHVFVCKSLRF